VSLLFTALVTMIRIFVPKRNVSAPQVVSIGRRTAAGTVSIGVLRGVLVTVSSVGAGAIGVAALLFLYPKVPTSKIVGIDIAHAIPLTLVVGVGQLLMGTVNFGILLSLLSGSIPGIIPGSWLSSVAPEKNPQAGRRASSGVRRIYDALAPSVGQKRGQTTIGLR